MCDEVLGTTQFSDSRDAKEATIEGTDAEKLETVRDNLALDMIASLIDVESRATGMHDRKGILDMLEQCMKKDFYSDEEDATDYYRKQLQRKKDMGGKYNERFFINVKDEGEEFEDVPEGADQ